MPIHKNRRVDRIKFSKTALLMIDMQGGFIDPTSSLCVSGAASSIPACASVLKWARDCGVAIYHIRRQYSYDGSNVELCRRDVWLSGGRPLCSEGSNPSSIDAPPELAELPGEIILIKPRFSAFFETNLHEMLQSKGIDTLILIGTTTPNCIRTTCYDALSYNYNVIIVEDATSSRSDSVQKANIEDMAFIGATITDSESLKSHAISNL